MEGMAGARRAYAALRVIEEACGMAMDVAPGFDGAERVHAAAGFIARAFPCTWISAWRNRSRSIDEIWSAAIQCASQGASFDGFLSTFCGSAVGRGMRHADARRAPLIFVAAVLYWRLNQSGRQNLDPTSQLYILEVIADASGVEAQDAFLKHDCVDQALGERLGDRYQCLDMESKVRCHAAVDAVAERSRVSRISIVFDEEMRPRSSSELEELVRTGVVPGRACGDQNQQAREGWVCVGAFALSFLTVLVIAASLPVAKDSVLWVIFAFPLILETCYWLAEQLQAWRIGPYSAVRYDYSLSGVEDPVWVAVPVLLHGEEQLIQLERTLLWNVRSVNDDGVRFVLLTDLADSPEEPSGEEDAATVERIAAMVERVNEAAGARYRRPVYFAHRRRMFVSSEGAWMGEGRKLGKIHLLHRAIIDGEEPFSSTSPSFYEDISRCRYLFVCDEDTQIGRDCIQRLAGVLAHPWNEISRETREMGGGHGMAVPSGHIADASVTPWRFPQVCVGDAANPHKPAPRWRDPKNDTTGQCLYTGKGLYDPRTYRLLCDEQVASEALSHDTIESFMLRPTYVDDAAIFESFPRSPASLARRDERWARGDMLNLLRFPRLAKSDRVHRKLLASITVCQQTLGWLGGFLGFPLILVSLWRPDPTSQLSLLAILLFPGAIRLVWRAVANSPNVGISHTLRLLVMGGMFLLLATAIRVCRAPRTFLVTGAAWGRAIMAWVTNRGVLLWSPASKVSNGSKLGFSWAEVATFAVSFASMLLLPASSLTWVALVVFCGWLVLPAERLLLIKKDDFHKRSV
ncbi:hypothetical protein [Stenotrophomonas maltophilia]|uniref:hypothetical protein n=1 Tax=Stenotrophomonas maltophilia TaxID=40324 RepID=UPI0007397094|nr:hypothetical protein [Stenotrophomonas maltophilia]QJP20830.1 hypothetical protein HKK60_15195 [Stenotrophomonas maltophilia]CRD47150.1 membrane hypothetical protein [Stenotrophomonas maltophilia]